MAEQGGDSDFFDVVLFDTWATLACDPPAPVRATSTTAMFDDGSGMFFVTLSQIDCLGSGSEPTLSEADVQFQVVDGNTMIEGSGTVWHRIGR